MPKNICIFGTGNVALATAAYLSRSGNQVTIYSRPKPNHDVFDNISANGIHAKFQYDDSSEENFRVRITTDEMEAVNAGSDLILVSINAHGHQDLVSKLRGVRHQPVIFFPGKFCTSYIVGNQLEKFDPNLASCLGEAATSLFFAESSYGRDAHSPCVRLINKKTQVSYGGIDEKRNAAAVELLNSLFGEGAFADGVNPLRVGLQNHDFTINPVSMIANEYILKNNVNPAGDHAVAVYGDLSEFDVELMEKVFKERQQIAAKFGYDLESISSWLDSIFPDARKVNGLAEKLWKAYGHKTVTVNNFYSNRRLREDVPFGLVPLMFLAEKVGVKPTNIAHVIALADKIMDKAASQGLGECQNWAGFKSQGPSFEQLGISWRYQVFPRWNRGK